MTGFTDPHADRDTGRELKQRALDLLDAKRPDYVLLARRALLLAALANGTTTADDMRDAVELPEGMNPKVFGSAPGPLARAGIICRVGFDTTCRPQAHARPVSIWAIRDRLKAEAWLRNNKPAAPTAIDATGNLDSPTCESEETNA